MLQAGSVRCQRIRSALTLAICRRVWENGLERAIAPASVPLWGPNPRQSLRSADRSTVTASLEFLNVAMGVLLITAPFGFCGYAYWRLFAHDSTDTVATAISLTFAAFNVARSALFIVDEIVSGAWNSLLTNPSLLGGHER